MLRYRNHQYGVSLRKTAILVYECRASVIEFGTDIDAKVYTPYFPSYIVKTFLCGPRMEYYFLLKPRLEFMDIFSHIQKLRIIIQNLPRPSYCDESVRPEKREPDGHDTEETLPQEYLDPRTDEPLLGNGHRDETEHEEYPFVFLVFYSKRSCDYRHVYSEKDEIIRNERNERDHQDNRERFEEYLQKRFHARGNYVYAGRKHPPARSLLFATI